MNIKEIKQKYGLAGSVCLTYAGSGDSGCIEDIDGNVSDKAREALEEWLYLELETRYGGWEINEGSSGTVTVDFDTGGIKWSHTELVESTDEFDEKF